jgi:hypothetical protein
MVALKMSSSLLRLLWATTCSGVPMSEGRTTRCPASSCARRRYLPPRGSGAGHRTAGHP